MQNSDDWLTAEQVQQAIRERGMIVPQSRLDRWRTEGLIPLARRRGRGRGLGRGQAEYPSITPTQAAFLHESLRRDRNVKRAGWTLWLNGYAVGSTYWHDELIGAADLWDANIPQIAIMLDDDNGALDAMATTVFQHPGIPVVLKWARKALGQDRFTEFLSNIFSIATGDFSDMSANQDPSDPDRQSASRILDLGLGLAAARDIRLQDGSWYLQGDYTPVLAELAASLSEVSMRKCLDAASETEIAVARDEIGFTLNLLTNLFSAKTAAAFRIKSAASLSTMSVAVQACMVMAWLRYRNTPGVIQRVNVLRDALQAEIQSTPRPAH